MPVYRRSDRRRKPYYYKFDLAGRTYKASFATAEEAKNAEAAARLRARQSSTSTAFLQAINRRLAYVRAYCTHQTYRQNKTRLKPFAAWQDLDLGEITPDLVRRRMVELSRTMSPSLANKHLIALRSVLEQAVNDGFLGRNPCRGVKFLPVARTVNYVPPAAAIEAVLALAQPLDRAYLTVIWQLGARVREVNRLTWADVDFPRHLVRLWTRKKRGGHLTDRLVAMSPPAYDALKFAWGGRHPGSPYVFTNPAMAARHPGQPERWCFDYRDKFFDRLCRLAGVPEMGYHALRHQRASQLADDGVSLAAIQEFLGHESAVTTAIYLHSLGVKK